MSVLDRFLGWINNKPKHKMSKDKFVPNNFIKHPYKTIEVLQKCLQEFGFKPKDWEIRERGGYDIQLPRKLTDEEKEKINKAYDEAEKERKRAADAEDGE